MSTLLPAPARRALILTSLAALPVAGCGGSGSGDAGADPAAAVPARAPIYIEATVRPSGDAKSGAEAASKKIFGTADPGKELQQLIDRAGRDKKVDFARDVRPWLGDRVGLWFTSLGDRTDGALIAAMSDKGKAEDFVKKVGGTRERDHDGTTYRVDPKDGSATAIVGEYVVQASSETAMKQAIDAQGGAESLSEAQRFQQANEATAGDDQSALGRAYLDPQGLLDAVARGTAGSGSAAQVTAFRQLVAGGPGAIGMRFTANGDALRLDTASIGGRKRGATGDAAKTLATLPGDSWLAVGLGDVGASLTQLLDQLRNAGGFGGLDVDTILRQLRGQSGLDVEKDVIDWMGDGGVFVQGRSLGDLGGALVVQSKDPAATARGIARVARFLRGSGISGVKVKRLQGDGVDSGITVHASGLGVPIHVAVGGDRFVLAVGNAALRSGLKPDTTLADNAAFKQAAGTLGAGVQPSFFVNVPPALDLAQGLGANDSPDYAKVRDALDAFTTLVGGGARDGDASRARLVLGLK